MRNELRVVVAGAALAVSLSADAADTSSNNVGFPIYKDGVLTIPRVDTAEQLGQYQDVSFRIQGGTWQLLAYKSLGSDLRLGPAYVNTVLLARTGDLPVQIILVVRGYLPDPCRRVGQVNQRRDANHYTVTINSVMAVPPETVCPAVLEPFESIVALPVLGLEAGTYSYTVNGITGTFHLTMDNDLPASALGRQ